MTFFYAIVLLGILIFIHELGHFLFAKLMKVKVLKFSLGFGPKIIGSKYGETEYQISAIPLGGYVKMLGEEPGAVLSEEEKARAYSSQPVWKRLVIVGAGPVFNIIFAAFIFSFVFSAGVPMLMSDVGEVIAESPASRAGLTKGDSIVGIDREPIKRWDEMTEVVHKSPGKKLQFRIKRGSEIIVLEITPEKKTAPNIFGESKEVGLIGIRPYGNTFIEKHAFPSAISQAVSRTWELSVLTLVSMIKLIQRIIPADTIGGPILIFQMAGQQAAQGPMSFFVFMAVISINLGVLNLLPIPILDGGHLLFLGLEAIRRKPLSERIVMIAQKVGLALLITLMVFAFYNDIMRLIAGKTLLK